VKIDNDLIIQAKQTMGERAAEIIANGIGIQKWNSRQLKGCCPKHSEKTPSFQWDKKHNMFKCFGCGETLDIVEYYMTYENLNFVESIKKLFNETGTNYNFDELDKKGYKKNNENKPYIYPEAVKEESIDTISNYLNIRCISNKTLLETGIRQNKGNIVFEYRNENGELLLAKYRPARKIKKGEVKTWCQKGKDTSPVLFGMDRIDTTKPLLICEGEIDRLSCIESGFKNVVSVPFGAGNYNWIEYNFEWLDNFNEIIIWSDNDAAGDNMRNEVVPRLEEYRCKIAKGTENDINLQLYRHGKQSVLDTISKAKDVPIKNILNMADVEDFDINKVPKIKSGYAQLDKYISGFVLPSVDIITGINSSGKSTLINQMCIAEPLKQGYKTFIFSGELQAKQLRSWIEFPICGRKYIEETSNSNNAPIGYWIRKEAKEYMKRWYKGNIFFYDNENDYTAKTLLKKMEEMARKHGIKNFILDNLMMIDLDCNTFELNKKQKEFVLDLKKFSRKFNSIIHLIAHPRKQDMIKRLTKMDVAGSGDITNLADYVLAVHRVTNSEKESVTIKGEEIPGCPYDCILDLFKNRPLGYQDKAIGLHFDMTSKRYYGDSDDLDMELEWTKEYKQHLMMLTAEKRGENQEFVKKVNIFDKEEIPPWEI